MDTESQQGAKDGVDIQNPVNVIYHRPRIRGKIWSSHEIQRKHFVKFKPTHDWKQTVLGCSSVGEYCLACARAILGTTIPNKRTKTRKKRQKQISIQTRGQKVTQPNSHMGRNSLEQQ
jgi:hypothetical protein